MFPSIRSTAVLLGSIGALCPVNVRAAAVIWRAQDFVTGANGNVVTAGGSTVTDWVSSAGTSVESDADGGVGNPLLLSAATPAGTAAVNFTSDRMNGSAAENPVAGANQFSIAMVFRATAAGVGTQQQWWQNSGIVDAEQAGGVNDWGTAINGQGQLALGIGGPDTTGYAPTNYADSVFHKALFRYDGITGNYDIFVDDAAVDLSATNKIDTEARNAATFGFGGIAIAANFFTGDLAEVRIFTGADSTSLNVGSLFSDFQNLHFAPQPNKTWSGTVNGIWDTTTPNFTGSNYVEGNQATFGDVAGNGAAVTRRNITVQAGGVNPSAVIVDNSTGDYTFAGAIKNTVLTKRGTSTATLGGAGDATDNAGLSATVEAGTLLLAKNSSGTVHAAAGVAVSAGATIRLSGTGGDQIADGGAAKVDGTFDLNGRNETIAGLTDAGFASGIVTNTASSPAPSVFTISGASGTSTYIGIVQDGTSTVALGKSGGSTQVLSGPNTYTAGTTISGGILRAGSDQAFGSGAVAVNAGGTAELSGGRTLGNNFTLSGGTVAGQGGTFDTLSGPVTVSAASTVRVEGGGVMVVSGSVSGTAGLTKIGPGTLSLAADNSATYSGPITIGAGVVQAGAVGAFGRGALTVNGIASLNDSAQTVGSLAGTGAVNLGTATLTAGSNNGSTTFTGSINGTGGLTKTGTGTLTLGGTNNYTGPTTISAGTVRLESVAAVPKAEWSASTLTGANGSAVTQWLDRISGVSADTFTSAPVLNVGTLGGQNVVRFSGNQALQVLGAVNPIANLSDYTLAFVFRTTTNGVGGATQWWANTGLVDAEQGGATNDWGTSFTSTGQVGGGNGNPDQTLYSTSGLADGRGHVVIFSVSGTDLTLNVDGLSTTVPRTSFGPRNVSRVLFGSLNGGNYFTGDLGEIEMYDGSVTGRRLRLVGAGLASTYGLGTTSIYETTVSDGIADISPVVLSGASSVLDLNGLNEVIGSLEGVAGSSVALNAGILTVGGNNTDTAFAGNISGQGTLIKIGTGAQTLSGNNTLTGNTIVRAGKLNLSAAASTNNLAGSPRLIVPAGGTLDVTGLSGGGITLGTQRLEGAGIVLGRVTTANGSILTPGDAPSIGTLTVGNLSLTTGTTLNFTLGTPGASIAAPGVASMFNVVGNLTLGSGLIFNPISNANANNQGVLGNGVYDLFSYTGTLSGFTGNNFQAPPVGTFNFSNQNNHIYVTVSGLLTLVWTGATNGAWDTTSTNWANGNAAATYQDPAIVSFADTNPISGTAVTNSNLTVQAGGVRPGAVTFNNNAVTYTINSSDTVGIAGVTGVTKNGTGTAVLAGANSFTGAVSVNSGILRAANSAALGTALGVTVASGAALEMQGAITTTAAIPLRLNGTGAVAAPAGALRSVSGNNTYTGPVTLTTNSTIGVAADTLTLGGAMDGTGRLTKVGAGTLVLNGASSASGGTTVAAGVLKLGNAQALGANDSVTTVSAGGSLDLNGQTIRGRGYTLALSGPGSGDPTTGAIFNSGLAQADASFDAMTLTGNASIGSNGNRFDIGRLSTVGNVGGGFVLTKVGSGQVGLLNASSGFSSVVVNGGTLLAENDLAYGDNGLGVPTRVTVNAGGTAATVGGRALANEFVLNGGSLSAQGGLDTYSGAITVSASSTVNLPAASTATFAGPLSGSAGLTKTGAGTLAFSQSNALTFNGGLTVSAGTVQADADGAFGRGALTVNGTAVLNSNQNVASLAGAGTVALNTAVLTTGADNSSSTFNGFLGGAGGLTKIGTGTLTLGGQNTYSGVTTVNGGTLRLEPGPFPTAKALWSASSLTGAAGSPVTQWTDQISGLTADAFTGSPTLGVGTLGGQNVVHFGGNQALELLASENPLAGAAEYSVALVFRTANNGVGAAGQWWENTGLVDAEQGGATNDWGVAFNGLGQVGGGNGNADQTVYSQAGLANGAGHVVIYSASSTELMVNVDGVSTTLARTGLAARNLSRVLFGSLNGGNYFIGDIAQISMFDRAVVTGELNKIGSSLATTYGLTGSTTYDTSILPDNGPLVLNGAGTGLNLNNKSEAIGSLAGVSGSSVTLGSATLTAGADNTDTTFLGAITGAGGVTKQGAGRWTLGGANTYGGATQVNAGLLIVSGSLNGTTGVTVANGGTLAGTGVITTSANGSVTLQSGAKLAAGNATGRLTLTLGTGLLDISAAVSLSNTQALAFTLGTSRSELLMTSGALNVGSAALGFEDFAFTAGPGFGQGIYTLFDTSSPIVGSLGTNLSGVVNGLFATLGTVANGQDIMLTVIPEPASGASLLLGMVSLLGLRRRSRAAGSRGTPPGRQG